MLNPEKPLISIVLATSRHLPFLKPALQSLSSQTLEDWELIAVLDGEPGPRPGATARQIRSLFPNAHILQQKRSGVSAARNYGISTAKGKFLIFMDDDDIWLPTKLDIQAKYLLSNPDITACWHPSQIIDKNGIPTGDQIGHPIDREDLLSLQSPGWCFPAFMFKKTTVIRCGNFNPWYPLCEDLGLIFALFEIGTVGWIDQLLIQYRKHDTNLTSNPLHMFSATVQIYEDRLRLAIATGDIHATHQLTQSVQDLHNYIHILRSTTP